MARRQLQIVGTESAVHPEIEEAAEAWRDARKESKAANEKAKQKRYELVALMESRNVDKYKYTEEDTGEEILISVEQEPKVRAKKTGDAESDIGEGLDGDESMSGTSTADEVHTGLIAQAEKAMADAGVVETADGDVVAPDTAAPKKPRGKAKKR